MHHAKYSRRVNQNLSDVSDTDILFRESFHVATTVQAWYLAMAPVPDSVYFPSLDRLLNGDQLLV